MNTLNVFEALVADRSSVADAIAAPVNDVAIIMPLVVCADWL